MTAAAATPVANPPTPEKVDELALQHDALDKLIDSIITKAKEDTKEPSKELSDLRDKLRFDTAEEFALA